MITHLSKVGALLALLLCWQPDAFAQLEPTTATNQEPIRLSPDVAEVVQMVQAGKSNSVILAHIKISPRMYDLSAQDVVNLEKLKVPTEFALAMIEHDAALARATLPKPSVSAETAANKTGEDEKETPATPVRQPVRTAEGVVVLPIPEPSGNRTNRSPEVRRRWTSSNVTDKAPPPPKLELIPDAPGRDYIWIKGNWALRGGRWSWEEGYWEQRPGPDVVWVDGFWSRHGRGYIWIPGKWR